MDCITDGPEFAANAKEQLIELVRQHYNHPSIFCWGLFNEMYHRKSAEFTPLLKLQDDVFASNAPIKKRILRDALTSREFMDWLSREFRRSGGADDGLVPA